MNKDPRNLSEALEADLAQVVYAAAGVFAESISDYYSNLNSINESRFTNAFVEDALITITEIREYQAGSGDLTILDLIASVNGVYVDHLD